jgi:phage I-like protein
VKLASFKISNRARDLAAQGKLPVRLKILDWGENKTLSGVVRVDDTTLSVLESNQKKEGLDRVAIDFEHNTAPGSTEYLRSSEPRPVAGYGVPRVIKGDGLYLEDIIWTPDGEKHAANFIDLSPCVQLDANGSVTFVHSVALTRAGAVEGLHFYATKEERAAYLNPDGTFKNGFDGCVAYMINVEGHDEDSAKKICGYIAKQKGLNTNMNTIELKTLAAWIGAPEDADAAALEKRVKELAALAAAAAQKKSDPSNPSNPSAPPDPSAQPSPALAALTAKVEALEKELTRLNTERERSEREQLIARFSAEGRVPKGDDGKPLSAEALAALGLAELRLLYANTPPTLLTRPRAGFVKGPDGKELTGLARAIAAHKQETLSANTNHNR